MIHHVSVGTDDLARSQRFYDAVLETLGLRLTKAKDNEILYGAATTIFSAVRPLDGALTSVGNGGHIAFAAETRAMVDAFYAAALEHGGSSDGAPGVRPEYDANYYGAFVRDPDGNKIEAVTFASK